MARDALTTSEPRCPQWWQVFGLRGTTGAYAIYAADVEHGIMRCTCPAWELRGREETCKHIRRVMGHGCLAGPDRAPGPNDFAAFGVAVLPCVHPTPRRARRIRQLCACGEPMMAPKLRLTDDAGHQLVRVTFDDPRREYVYAWDGDRPLGVGDAVTIERPGHPRATVVALGSDWAGSFTYVGQRLQRR
ncbi:hypothetical protein BST13_24755 [Mycobacterium aquaticum]|uniref:SWIM-type domain-containing protein n=2 Tax=Mycobacterium aquaticum TaxID=1927124 RepID=A0A1X0ANG8_9MYCO|nr:hypothetical protein BST13_24755 [Mycobacterium aquaticum]